MIGTKLQVYLKNNLQLVQNHVPIGLKYLNETKFIEDSCKTFSHSCLVLQGDSAFLNKALSSTGNLSGLLYTVQEEEKLNY